MVVGGDLCGVWDELGKWDFKGGGGWEDEERKKGSDTD